MLSASSRRNTSPTSPRIGVSNQAHPHPALSWTKPLDQITHRDVVDALDAIEAPSERAHALKDIRTFFNWCIPRYLKTSPCVGIKKPPQKSRDRVLTDDELARSGNGREELGYPYGTIVQLLILTGQRSGEIAALQWEWGGGVECGGAGGGCRRCWSCRRWPRSPPSLLCLLPAAACGGGGGGGGGLSGVAGAEARRDESDGNGMWPWSPPVARGGVCGRVHLWPCSPTQTPRHCNHAGVFQCCVETLVRKEAPAPSASKPDAPVDAFVRATADSFTQFSRTLSPLAFQPDDASATFATISLRDAIRDIPDAVDALFIPFIADNVAKLGLFYLTAHTSPPSTRNPPSPRTHPPTS